MNQADIAERKRNRQLKLAATLMFSLSIILIGGLFFLQQQAAFGRYGPPQRPVEDPKIVKEMSDARIAKAQLLRDQWKAWALLHKAELKRMLHAQPNETSAMTAVWEALPMASGMPSNTIRRADLYGNGAKFSWNPSSKGIRLSINVTSKRQKEIAAHLAYKKRRLQHDFTTLRDVELSRSSNSGPATISLWASGRITENRLIENPHIAPGKPIFIEAPPVELAPPYDFLK